MHNNMLSDPDGMREEADKLAVNAHTQGRHSLGRHCSTTVDAGQANAQKR